MSYNCLQIICIKNVHLKLGNGIGNFDLNSGQVF